MRAVRLLYAFFPGSHERVAQSQPARISMRRQRELAHITGEHMAIPAFPVCLNSARRGSIRFSRITKVILKPSGGTII